MTNDVKKLINSAVLKMIESTSSTKKLKKLEAKHDEKMHFIPKKVPCVWRFIAVYEHSIR